MAKAQQTRPVDDLVVHKERQDHGSKKNCLPLAAADHFAYAAWCEKSSPKPLGVAKNQIKSEASYRGNAAWIDLNRDTLNSLQEQAIRIASGARSSLPPALQALLS
jgi:hypothetical protein